LGKKIDSKAIHSAIIRAGDAPAAIKILLEAGVNVNAKSLTLLSCKDWFILGEETGLNRETALIATCKYRKRESVEALLRGGARRDLKDDYRKSTWDRAKEAGRSDIVELLDKY
jgi:ankyrin repeat protein